MPHRSKFLNDPPVKEIIIIIIREKLVPDLKDLWHYDNNRNGHKKEIGTCNNEHSTVQKSGKYSTQTQGEILYRTNNNYTKLYTGKKAGIDQDVHEACDREHGVSLRRQDKRGYNLETRLYMAIVKTFPFHVQYSTVITFHPYKTDLVVTKVSSHLLIYLDIWHSEASSDICGAWGEWSVVVSDPAYRST